MAPEHIISEEQSSEPPLLHIETIAQYVALAPSTLGNPHSSLCASLFSPLLLTYYPPARGIVLAYSNVRLSGDGEFEEGGESNKRVGAGKKVRTRNASRKPVIGDEEAPTSAQPEFISSSSTIQAQENAQQDSSSDEEQEEQEDEDDDESEPLLLKVIDEYSAVFTWAQADFLVFRPLKNVWLDGRIASASSSHLTISVLNAFSVSVLRRDLPEGWEWVGGASGEKAVWKSRETDAGAKEGDKGTGYYVDGDGNPVDGVLRLRIRDFDLRPKTAVSKGLLRIEGSLLSVEEEEERRKGGASVAKSTVKAGKEKAGKEKSGREKSGKKKSKKAVKELRGGGDEGDPMELE